MDESEGGYYLNNVIKIRYLMKFYLILGFYTLDSRCDYIFIQCQYKKNVINKLIMRSKRTSRSLTLL